MKLENCSLKDKKTFKEFLNLRRHELSVYAFENIYIWKGLFDIKWAVFGDSLCVFFRDKIGCFMYLPPLAKTVNPRVIEESFNVMDGFNKNRDISRIENVEEDTLAFYKGLGFECRSKYPEYLCERRELAQLKGNKFKSQRAGFNYFTKNYKFEYVPFSPRHKQGCLRLYSRWMRERKKCNRDPVYQGMLEDSLRSFKVLLETVESLDLTGRVIIIDGEIKAVTFGFKLNRETFCVLYEVTDLSVKGLSQFIFRRFSQELREYKYINIMDDSGLENLKKVKLSYRPVRSIAAYIASRRNE